MTTTRPPKIVRAKGWYRVMEAVLDAAIELFAERGPAGTPIRDLATRSGVNHGLCYRHFGTKDQLVAAVLDRLSTHLQELVASQTPAAEIEIQVDRHVKVL